MSEYQRDERIQALMEWLEKYSYKTGLDEELCRNIAFVAAETLPAIESLEQRLQEAEQDLLAHQKNTDQEVGDLTQKIEQLESEAAVKDYALNDVLHRIETENLHWGEIDTIKDALSVGTAGRELLAELEALRKQVREGKA